MGMMLMPRGIGRRKGPFEATGGTTTTYSSGGVNYKSHTFTSSGTFAVTGEPGVIDIMTIGAGGGGAGAVSYTHLTLPTTPYV